MLKGTMSRIALFLLLNHKLALKASCTNTDQDDFKGYKEVKVELHKGMEQTKEVLVANNMAGSVGVNTPFTSYAVCGSSSAPTFNVNNFFYKKKYVKLDELDLKAQKVYNVYTYWNKEKFLAFCVRYDEGGTHHYKYYKLEGQDCTLVDPKEFQGEDNGHLAGENLTNLLNEIDLNTPDPPKDSHLRPSGMATSTALIIALVVSLVVALIIVGVFYFMSR